MTTRRSHRGREGRLFPVLVFGSQKVPIVRKHVLSVVVRRRNLQLGTCTATASQLQSQDADQRTPDYDALKNKAALVSYSFGLKRRVVEIDRDADRRWMFASMTARAEEAEGKTPSDSAPFEDLYKFSKETAETVHKFLAEANSASSAPAGLKKDIEKVLKENPPSDDFKVRFPRVLHERLAKKMGSLQRDPPACFPSSGLGSCPGGKPKYSRPSMSARMSACSVSRRRSRTTPRTTPRLRPRSSRPERRRRSS